MLAYTQTDARRVLTIVDRILSLELPSEPRPDAPRLPDAA